MINNIAPKEYITTTKFPYEEFSDQIVKSYMKVSIQRTHTPPYKDFYTRKIK